MQFGQMVCLIAMLNQISPIKDHFYSILISIPRKKILSHCFPQFGAFTQRIKSNQLSLLSNSSKINIK